MNPRIQILTDDAIKKYSEQNILTDYRDINLKIETKVAPYQGGIYDQDIFGSVFSDRCNCGKIRTTGIRCPNCGSQILTEAESFSRFARIELPVYYSTKFKLDKIIAFLKSNFVIESKFNTKEFIGLPWSNGKCLDILQWEYDTEKQKLILTDNVTDFTKCSFDGLLNLIQLHFPDLLEEYRAYINKYILVIPMVLRAPQIRVENKQKRLENSYTSIVYKNILYCIQYYNEYFPTMKEDFDKAIFRGSFRKLVSSSLDTLSQLMNSSKANLARVMQSNRMSNSGRCTIVPDPTLKGDEVVIPIHLMYEACRGEFIQYLAEKKGITTKEAEALYKDPFNDEVQKLFHQYIEGEPGKPETAKYVIINRAPTLYDLSMFSCRVRLTHDYTMKIPQILCKPTNGDFDGDTFSYYAVPKNMNSMVNNALSARNRFYYKKNQKPLFTPTQEIMRGLVQATKVNMTNSKLEVFDSIEDAKEFKKENKDFRWQTLCIINGKKTTLARAILTELFDKDIDAYVGGFDKCITAKNCTMLYEQLADKEDRLDRIQKIQEFALLITTMSGATAISISDLYLDIDESYIKKIREVENNPNMDSKMKELKIREIYREYQEVELKKVPEEVRVMIDESNHMKVSELRDMAVQQLNVGPQHEFSVAETSLSQGLSSEDYANHAIENRLLQDIKQLQVPQGGYVTRQFTYLASEYIFKEGEDKDNKGILLARSKARGRTMVDGTVLGESNSDEMVKVRSLVTSTLPSGTITRDMLSTIIDYKVGSKVGMNLISSLTEQLTQGGLALKHGGNLFNLDPTEAIKAPDKGKLVLTEDKILLECKTNTYEWPRGSMFVQNYIRDNNVYNEGEILGRNYHPVTPAYKLDSIIKLCSARTTNSKKKFANNKKVVSECYAINDGTITYDYSNGYPIVRIDNIEYTYNPDALYYYPAGSKVKKYDRICTGTLDMNSMVYKVTDYVELYYFFRKQFEELLDVSNELIEFIYILLVKDLGDNNLEIKSVMKNIHGSESFFKSLAFGDARKSFQKIDYEGMDFVADPITAVMLSMVMNDQI